jgi:serine/threonine protein kinase
LPLARHIAGEIILALEYMHNMGVIHRDLKPGNVVLDKQFHIKLIDFATCKVLNPKI